jgi:hypothetical protein
MKIMMMHPCNVSSRLGSTDVLTLMIGRWMETSWCATGCGWRAHLEGTNMTHLWAH